MEDVQRQWGPTGVRSWKLPLLLRVIGSGRFAGKRSTPWGPGTVHDYMHAKITVADDVVFLGSFNLSHSGEMNSENVLEIHDPALAERLAGYVDGVRAAIRSRGWTRGPREASLLCRASRWTSRLR